MSRRRWRCLDCRLSYVTALPRHAITETLVSTLRGLGVDTNEILWRKQGRLGLYFVEVGAKLTGFDRSLRS